MVGEVARPAGNLGRLTIDLGREVWLAAARNAIFSRDSLMRQSKGKLWAAFRCVAPKNGTRTSSPWAIEWRSTRRN